MSYEVTITIEGKAENAGKKMFQFELVYGGVFRLLNIPKEQLSPMLLIECPRLLFPFAREIIATAVRDGGFPPLMLDPVDFVGLYRQNMARQTAANQPATGQAELIPEALAGGQIFVPDRLVAQSGDEGAMRLAVDVGHPRRERHQPLPARHFA